MYTRLEKALLCAPVAVLGLPALLNPTESELWEREAELAWHPDEGVGELVSTLRLLGVVVIFEHELKEFAGGHNNA